MLKKENTVVVDVRNHYETILGRFDGQQSKEANEVKSDDTKQDDDIKRLRKQVKFAQNQSAELEEAKKKIIILDENVKWQTTQVQGKDSELAEVKQTVHNL